MSDKRVTLSDIAVKAEVHVTTVSLALRNHPRLPETTRRRIQALAKKMGYAPDPFLRALVAYRGGVIERRNTPTLAYVTNWTTRWGWKKPRPTRISTPAPWRRPTSSATSWIISGCAKRA